MRVVFKKVGNRWYPCVDHCFASTIELDDRLNRYFNQTFVWEEVIVTLTECESDNQNLFFTNSDIESYYKYSFPEQGYSFDSESFIVRFKINNHEFEFDEELLYLIETHLAKQINKESLEFNKKTYKLWIW